VANNATGWVGVSPVFSRRYISKSDSILVIKNTPETALPRVEMEKTMYCLGEKAENRA
jgi:hypothetical protein